MGSPSSIHRLPPEAKDALDSELRKPGGMQTEALAAANRHLEEAGDPARVSRSAVNRYAQRMRAVGERIQQSYDVADAFLARAGDKPTGKVGHLGIEIVRTLAFDCGLTLLEEGVTAETAPAVIRSMRMLATTLQSTEQAAGVSTRRETEIRRQAALDLVAAVEKEAKDAEGTTVSSGRVREIVKDIYGI